MNNKLLKDEVLLYEIRASWWASFMSTPWLQDLASNYFIWKVNRKYGRYEYWREISKR